MILSNSDRDPDDLPILKNTYTVYHYNYERDTQEAVHNHIHQIEAVMRKHGGQIWAESLPDQGATFYFTFGSPQLLPAQAE